MGVFTRFRDVVNANINAMLERAEDPDKLLLLISKEMEDTLASIRSACMGALAAQKRIQADIATAEDKARLWAYRAQLAVDKGRDELAREALLEKRQWRDRGDSLRTEHAECAQIIEQYNQDITTLVQKLNTVREKQRELAKRRAHQRMVYPHKRVQRRPELIAVNFSHAMSRFERVEDRIERIESGDLHNVLGRKPTLDEKFKDLERQSELDEELAQFKSRSNAHAVA